MCSAFHKQELKTIPGASILKSPDSLKLEVTVRNGTIIEIHPDQVKKWQQTAFGPEFKVLVEKHEKTFKQILEPTLKESSGTALVEASSSSTGQDEPTRNRETRESTQVKFKSWDSYEKLHEEDEITHKVASEVAGVNLLKSKSGKCYAISEKSKVVPKNTILGGFGTGKCLGYVACL